MLSDSSLCFDRRTAMDLRDKFRNLRKKQAIRTGIPFQITPMKSNDGPSLKRSARVLTDWHEPFRASRGVLETQAEMPQLHAKDDADDKMVENNSKDLNMPRLQELRLVDDDLLCLMIMEEIGERVIGIKDVPVDMQFLFHNYKKRLSEQLKLVDQALKDLEEQRRITAQSSLTNSTTKVALPLAIIEDEEETRDQNGKDKDYNGKENHKTLANYKDDDDTRHKSHRQVNDQARQGDNIANKLRRARADPSKNCIIQ